MTFTGFPDEALLFYEGLEADNSRTYWNDNKPRYERYVRAPMEALLAEVEPEFGSGKMFRPYRDVRFARDKSPYKTTVAATAGEHYVQLSASGLLVAAGYYDTASDQVERLRRAVADDVQGPALAAILDALRRGGYAVDGQRLKTRPHGYPADHPRIDLLRYRTLVVYKQWPPEPWLHTRAALQRVRRAWRAFVPLTEWLAANVGAASAT